MPNPKPSDESMDWRRLLSRQRAGNAAAVSATATAAVPVAADSAGGRGEVRSEYQRDFDRIVFSSALRRLQDKTQVFPLAQSDDVRTRLTHSLEVSSVGRTLGVMAAERVIGARLGGVQPHEVGAVVAAACLAHDIGNPPFGHAGEDAIRLWFAESPRAARVLAPLECAQREDFLRFEGNAQGFRLLTRLQNPDNPGGLRLTAATLGAFSKYPCASWPPLEQRPPGAGFRKYGFFQDDSQQFRELAATLGLGRAAEQAWRRHPLAYLVEAADDICYLIIDLEDAYRLRRLSYPEVLELLAPLADSAEHAVLSGLRDDAARVEMLRAKAIGHLIEQVCDCFAEREAAILAGRFEGELLHGVAAAPALRELQQKAQQKVYFSQQVVEVGIAGYQVLGGLLEAFVGAVEDASKGSPSSRSRMLLALLAPGAEAEHSALAPYQRLLAVTDHIAAMSDTYAIKLYRTITGISLPNGPLR